MRIGSLTSAVPRAAIACRVPCQISNSSNHRSSKGSVEARTPHSKTDNFAGCDEDNYSLQAGSPVDRMDRLGPHMMGGLRSKCSLVESSYSKQIRRKRPASIIIKNIVIFCTGAFLLCRLVAYKAVNDKKFQFLRIHRF